MARGYGGRIGKVVLPSAPTTPGIDPPANTEGRGEEHEKYPKETGERSNHDQDAYTENADIFHGKSVVRPQRGEGQNCLFCRE